MAKPIHGGYHTVTPGLTFKSCDKAIEFYTKAFGAEVIDHLKVPGHSGTMHATIQIGDSIVMMGDEVPCEGACKSAETLGGSPVSLYIYVSDVDAAFKRAIAAGGIETMPVADMFWGDRAGNIKDPFGYSWMIATHREDLSPEEIRKGAEAFMAQMAGRT